MDTDRTPVAETAAAQPPACGSQTDSRPGRAHRHSVRAPERHPVENAPEGDGLRLREHVLATVGPLATRGRVEAAPSRLVNRIATPRPARSSPCSGRQRLAPRAARGKKTGPNPTDRRK